MEIKLSYDRREALPGADFVTTQMRVGRLPARVLDERIPLSHGMIGQETNGAGGMFKAFRTIPVIFDIVKDMEELCPDEWLINFTNPAVMVTEAIIRHTNFQRAIGLCKNAWGRRTGSDNGNPGDQPLCFCYGCVCQRGIPVSGAVGEICKPCGAKYSDAACNLIQSIYNDTGDIQYVDVRNNGAISDLPADSAVEVACRITADGPKPLATGELRLQVSGYVQMMKAFKRMTVGVFRRFGACI